jgi:hypothetical protein
MTLVCKENIAGASIRMEKFTGFLQWSQPATIVLRVVHRLLSRGTRPPSLPPEFGRFVTVLRLELLAQRLFE